MSRHKTTADGRRTTADGGLPSVVALLLLGFALRAHALDSLPPGWRDDEVIETTVHAQRVLDGELPLFFPEAEGHEPLYHWLSAGAIALWGRGLFQVRLVSALFGVLALAANYRLARRLFGRRVALLATFALAFSFWGLMYGRVKIRHISVLVFVLLAFDALFHVSRVTFQVSRATRHAVLFTLFAALSLYTYLAARAAPLIVAVFAAYLAAFHRPTFAMRWKGLAAMLAATALLALPLFAAMRAQPDAPGRLEVVGAPLAALLAGDPGPALRGTLDTLGMLFAGRGDPEALYNLPGRPVFEPLGAILLAAGLVVCAARWRDPRHAFLLIWLIVGLAPGFVSTPAASLGHTIVAMPAVYLVLAVGVDWVGRCVESRVAQSRLEGAPTNPSPLTPTLLRLAPALLLALLAFRDLRDYFVVWPSEPLVRLLYRADMHQAARELEALGATGAALTDRLSLWDARALELDAPGVQGRWFNPEGAMLYAAEAAAPVVVFADPPASDWARGLLAAAYAPAETTEAFTVWMAKPGARRHLVEAFGPEWEIGLRFGGSQQPARARPGDVLEIAIIWSVVESYAPPAPRIGSSAAAPPQPFTTFVHVFGPDGEFVTGYDRFDASGFSLRPGDLVAQRYLPQLPPNLAPGEYRLAAGFYDPVTGARFAAEDGQASFVFATVEVAP